MKQVVIREAAWNVTSGSYISSLEFANIEFRQEILNNYFMNINSSYTMENISFVNCDFIRFGRCFGRHQAANAKHLMNVEMEGCRFEECGWQGSAYGTFHLNSFDRDNGVSYDQVDRVVFRNCTFSRDNDGTRG